MINTIEELLKTHQDNAPAGISMDVGIGEEFHDDTWRTMQVDIDADLSESLESLGVIYPFGGSLEVNPMAIRVLKRLKIEGKPLTEEMFRQEIEFSKELYHSQRFYGEAEMERA